MISFPLCLRPYRGNRPSWDNLYWVSMETLGMEANAFFIHVLASVIERLDRAYWNITMLGVSYSSTQCVCEPAITHTYVLMKLLYQTALYRYSTIVWEL